MPEISKAYEPQSVEDRWYDFWLKQGCFTADPARVSPKRPAYSIVIPPPNVTGVLTMGHVLNNTIQDILARKARMDGKEVLWLPGTDHAGIATEGVVARQLSKEEKKSKRDIGREEFLKRVWTWKEKHGGIIIQQLKKLGASCDWTRERFTMDEPYARCVQKVFVELYKKGLIYRGKRMVNWCPATQTALSDEEVIMKPQSGVLYYFKVEVVDSSIHGGSGRESAPTLKVEDQSRLTSAATGKMEKETFGPVTDSEGRTWLTIATTRPETIPGDTAVAVNPKDPRYAKYIGKHVIRPLPAEFPREQKLIPIIGDEHVDFEFGTGVLKVTPAHDKADFEIGQRHKLAQIEVITANGHMSDLAGADLKGLDRFKARKVAIEKLTELGSLEKEEPYTNNVGYSERADVPIEPRLSEQWFLKYPGVEKSRNCVEQTGSPNQPERLTEISPGQRPGMASENDMHPEGVPDDSTAPAGADVTFRGTEPRALPGANLPQPSGLAKSKTDGKMRFHPQRWAKVYDHWLGNIQDWCISRQLWWGHRIPVWTLTWKNQSDGMEEMWNDKVLGHLKEWIKEAGLEREVFFKENSIPPFQIQILTFTPNADAHLGELVDLHRNGNSSANSEFGKRCPHGFNLLQLMVSLEQDPDVLDTWFSSWLWPFATMGWPEQTPTLKAFYPTTDLVTGPDIIFFWVARMIMAGYEFMGDPKFGLPDAMPFRNVYFTGIIRDKQGRKMSKSLGNSPDPLDLIGKYGADALRFGTMRSAPLGQDILFDEQNVELGRNFCNKLWNACRFRQMVGSGGSAAGEVQGEIDPKLLTTDDKWILLKLDAAIREMNTAFAEYKFSDATATLYRFFWSEYCDWYVEASKAVLVGRSRGNETEQTSANPPPHVGSHEEKNKANTLAVIDFVLSHTLRLFHPFLPFITEELWHGMGYAEDMPDDQGGKTILFAPWPKPLDDDFKGHYGLDDCYLKIAGAKYDLVTEGRNLRRTANIPANKKVRFVLKPANHVPPHDVEVLKLLLNAEAFDVDANFSPGKNTLTVRAELGDLYLPLEGLIDKEAETARLKKELEKIGAEITKIEQKLANPNFTRKVPPNILAEQQQRLAEWQGKHDHVKTALAALQD